MPVRSNNAWMWWCRLLGVVSPLGFAWTGLSQGATGNSIGLVYTTAQANPGYTLFAPAASHHTYLIDIHGQLIRRWTSTLPTGHAAYLLPDGHLLRSAVEPRPGFNAGGRGGRVEEFDWDGNLVWSYVYASLNVRHHHDAIKLPNGNVLLVAWERRSGAEATAAGRNPGLLVEGELWPDTLVEVAPEGSSGGTVVWAWRAWDHLIQDYDPTKPNFGVVGEHPEKIDLNFASHGRADWLHVNGIDYHPGLDQIVLSVHGFDEIWIIDHSTTMAEAAGSSGGRQGRGGDLLYRWGNPRAYRRGGLADQKLFAQHNPQWITSGLPGAGRLLVFNNGQGRPGGNHSSIDEWTPPLTEAGGYALEPGEAFGPTVLDGSYLGSPPSSFYAMNVSGCQRLPNGNTLICQGPEGVFFEVTPDGTEVWRYICPVIASGPLVQGSIAPYKNMVFRSPRYLPSHPAFTGRDLTPLGTVELQPAEPLEIIAFLPDMAGLRLTWASSPDLSYRIHYRPTPGDGPWTVLATNLAHGTRTHWLETDTDRMRHNAGFYRVSRP